MSKKRGRGEGPSAEKIAEDQLRWATFFAAENDNVLDAYSLEPLDPTVNNNAHAVHFCPVPYCDKGEGSEGIRRDAFIATHWTKKHKTLHGVLALKEPPSHGGRPPKESEKSASRAEVSSLLLNSLHLTRKFFYSHKSITSA